MFQNRVLLFLIFQQTPFSQIILVCDSQVRHLNCTNTINCAIHSVFMAMKGCWSASLLLKGCWSAKFLF